MIHDSRLKDLKSNIKKAKESLQPKKRAANENNTFSGKFFNVGVELTAGVLLGVGLGLLTDWFFNISPWGLITFFILGSSAGMMNVYRALTKEKPKDKEKTQND